MPIYEYQCSACNHHMDALQKMSEAPLTECPLCHKPALQKVMSATSFQLKGTGWYATDFKSKPKAETKPDTKVSNDANIPAATTSTEPKPATTPPAETKTEK
jgi:putative FmdB family regulatory protein